MFVPASRNVPGEPPKCKYFIVTMQTLNVVFATIMLFVEWKSDRARKTTSHHGTILKSFIAILVVFVGIKLFFCYKDHGNPGGSSPKGRCRRDLLIGYGAISIFGYIPLICMYVTGYNPTLLKTILMCYILPGLIIPLFILQHFKKYQVCHENRSTNFRAACFFLHVIVFVAIAFFVGQLKDTKEFAPYFIMWDTLMFSAVRAEFLVVLVNGVCLKERLERPSVAELRLQEPLRRSSSDSDSDASSHDSISEHSLQIEINHTPISNAIECQICLLRYSNFVIPRILVGCGHTICEKCVEKLTRIENRQNRVLCPFCRNSTRMPGGKPKQLPKNFAVLDIVTEQKNQRQTGELAQEETVT